MDESEKDLFIEEVWESIEEAMAMNSDDSDKEEILLGLASLGERATSLPTKRRKKLWMKEWRKQKEDRGSFAFLNGELLVHDEQSYRNYLRVSKSQFDFLLSLIREDIQRSDTSLRNAIPAEEKLAVTLRFIATGESYISLDYQMSLSQSAIAKIVPEFSSSQAEWEKIAKDFAIKWQFPNCLGALDGKHINFRPPRRDGAFYHNYKGTNSIILLALVDANCRFIFVDVGCNGRSNDAGVFLQSKLNSVLTEKKDIPPPSAVGNRCLPYVVVGDDAFPLRPNLMKPYPYHTQSQEKQCFNYRFSRARHVVEHAFGILSNRFRVFLTPINLKVDTVQTITFDCCALHNYLIDSGDAIAQWTEVADIVPDNQTSEINISHNPRRGEAENIRQEFTAYFNNEGKLDWPRND